MQNLLTTCALVLLSISLINAQSDAVGIGTTTPDPSAILDISSNGQGILIPRMDSTSRMNINSPAVGLMVFDSTTNGFWYHGNNGWLEISAQGAPPVGAYYCLDSDGDGFGDPTRPTWVPQGVMAPAGFITNCGDLNDTDSTIFIGAPCDVDDPTTAAAIDSNGMCVDTAVCEPDSCGPFAVQFEDNCVWGTCWQPGIATVYGTGQGGNCGWNDDDLLLEPFAGKIAAVGSTMWDSGLGCGDVYDLVCTSGSNTNNCPSSNCTGNTVRVMVVDQCPECPVGHFDLSTLAWDALIASSGCIADLEWRKVGHEYGVSIQNDLEGSNPWFLKLFPKFSNKKIVAITVTSGSDEYNAVHTSNQGFWTLNPSNALVLPFTLTYTAEDGTVLPAPNAITTFDGGNQDSGVNFSFD